MHTAAVLAILEACRRAGKVPGIFAGTPALAQRWIEAGFRFITVGADARLLEAAVQQTLLETRHGMQEALNGVSPAS